METHSPLESSYITKSADTIPRIEDISKTTRRLLFTVLLLASTLNHSCATQQKTKEPPTYNFTKPGKIRQVIRKINFCAASPKDIENEAKRCTNNKKIVKNNSQTCLECDTTAEVIDYN